MAPIEVVAPCSFAGRVVDLIVDPAFVDPAFVDLAFVDPAFGDPAFVVPAFVDPEFVDAVFPWLRAAEPGLGGGLLSSAVVRFTPVCLATVVLEILVGLELLVGFELLAVACVG